jgi:hypothetical protein
MSNAIPKFSFGGSTIKSEEDLATLEGGAKREDKSNNNLTLLFL